jgi:hypothetical protein
MLKKLVIGALVLLLTIGISGAASEQIVYGNPFRVYYGLVRLGNASLSPGTTNKYPAKLYIEAAGNSTAGYAAWDSRTAGGVLRETILRNPITATASTDLYWPGAYPVGTYLMNMTVGGQMGFVDPSTLGGSFTLAGTTGTETISAGNTFQFAAGTGILTIPVTATDTVTINTAWKRTGTLLEPATADDQAWVIGSVSGDAMLLGKNTSTGNNSTGVYGYASGATGQTRGVAGRADSSDNAAYGVFSEDRTYLGTWADFLQQAAHPAAPPATEGRLWLADASVSAWEDHKLLLTDEGGNVHDLTCQMKQAWGGAGLASEMHTVGKDPFWIAQKHGVAPVQPTITDISVVTYDFINHQWDTSYGSWAWTAVNAPPGAIAQTDVAVGVSFRKFGDGSDRAGNCRIIVKARVMVSDDAMFTSCKLFLSDASADNSSLALSADFKAAAADATWQEVTLAAAGTDVGGWTDNLRAGLEMYGAAGVAGAQYFQVDWLAVEQWVD